MHPIQNLDDIDVFDDVESNGFYTSQRALFSSAIGARQLGYNLTILPPGKAQCPFHVHRRAEEMFLILDGEGELRFGDQRHAIRRHDVIACPAGGPEVAHQIINTGTEPLRYLALSTVPSVEICEYPDSDKVSLYVEHGGETVLRKIFRAEDVVSYYERESLQEPGVDPAP